MSEDPNTWTEVVRNQGIAAAVGAVFGAGVLLFKTRMSVAVIGTKFDTMHDDLKRIAEATEKLVEVSARQDERIKNLEKRL